MRINVGNLPYFNDACIISKRFGDAGFADLLVQSEVFVDGSVRGVLSGKMYNRVVRYVKLLYEAL